MSKVIFDMSMSLDGFMMAANPRPEEPLGEGGERLHEWAFGDDERNRQLMAGALANLGAVICGRTTYDDSLPFWGADGPTSDARRPIFVVTHEAPSESPQGGVYTFVTDGIESALEQAKTAAGDENVTVMGGASMGKQYMGAGLVDEISVHVVPVLFGAGKRMFGPLEVHVELEPVEMIETAQAIPLRFRIVK